MVWLGPKSALQVLAALDVWRSVGFWAIFFLAAIIGLPRELYQAAELDGANGWQRFHRLTLPLLRRVILFAVVVATIFGLQVFDTALILTDGGPGTATLTIVYRIWTYIFGVDRQGRLRRRHLGRAAGRHPDPHRSSSCGCSAASEARTEMADVDRGRGHAHDRRRAPALRPERGARRHRGGRPWSGFSPTWR